ncbi:phosphoadenylyl-sulfate reductase [Glaciecola siphonariae]|uniref:Phosphoadenosine 5'-phosphosulfate reductase n=1 Tax=Glaciecola siphonariae TaxID=521012 RepID=A0ABV9LYP9_9ALTE
MNLAKQLSAKQKLMQIDLAASNEVLKGESAVERVQWALANLPGNHIVSSSFGAQSAVMLHLLSEAAPNIPVVLTDTGYLFPETYQFIDELTERLNLNLQVYRAPISAAWQEARFGKMWEQGIDGIEKYNALNKVEPMKRALHDFDVSVWFAGLRRSQSDSRQNLPFLQRQGEHIKVHPLADYSNKRLHEYMLKHKLPYHPLWEKGFVSIGDWHTTRALEDGMSEQDTRFFGLKRECGLHEFGDGDGI